MRKLNARQLTREKSMFRYSSALERGDFDTITRVLQEAEHDPALAQMITEINTVYESETLRLSPSLNHSTNHRQKELLMTTIVLPSRQRNIQRWLPFTVAAACVSMLFIGALLMRPNRPGNFQAGIQVSATPSPAASPTRVPSATFIPTAIPSAGVEASALPPTIVQFSASAVGTPVCGGLKIITQDTIIYVRPSNNSTAIGFIKRGTQAETLATGLAAEDDTSTPQTQWFFIKSDVDGNSVQGWVSANLAQPLDPANPCPANDVVVASRVIPPTVIPVVQPAIGSSRITCDSKDAVIISPSNDTVVSGTVDISGIATVPHFGLYQLEIIGIGTGGNYISMVDSTQPVVSVGELGRIDLSSFPPENYGLRLSVYNNTKQLQGSCLVNITLARAAAVPNAEDTATVGATVASISMFPISGVVTSETLARTSPAANGAPGMTLSTGVVVTVDSQSPDGQWVHVSLDGGKHGWVLSGVIQIENTSAQVSSTSATTTSIQTKGIVSVEQAVLRTEPNANARMIRMLGHNTTLIVTESAADGLWVNIILPNGTQGWLLANEVQTDGVPQAAQPAILCWGTIGTQPAQVFSRPISSSSGVAVDTLNPQTNVVIFDVDDQSGNGVAWYYVQGNSDGKVIQGWIQSDAFEQHNYCSQLSSPPDQFTVVPANSFSLATVVPPDAVAPPAIPATPTAYFDSVLRGNPPEIVITRPFGSIPANTRVQITSVSFDGKQWTYQVQGANGTLATITQDDLLTVTTGGLTSTTASPGICHIVNQQRESVRVYSAPSSNDSETIWVNNLAPNAPATVLYQQRNRQTGEVWYLVLAVMQEGKQISGWVSVNGVTVIDGCPPVQ